MCIQRLFVPLTYFSMYRTVKCSYMRVRGQKAHRPICPTCHLRGRWMSMRPCTATVLDGTFSSTPPLPPPGSGLRPSRRYDLHGTVRSVDLRVVNTLIFSCRAPPFAATLHLLPCVFVGDKAQLYVRMLAAPRIRVLYRLQGRDVESIATSRGHTI